MPQKRLRLNLIGSYTTGYVGEVADETILARELESLGHFVQRVPRDIWKAVVDGESDPNWIGHTPVNEVDINIVCKWHHFNDQKYINELRRKTGAPVVYWLWDYMCREDWHEKMVEACDLYISNDVYSGNYGHKAHYFPFDVADGSLPVEEWNNQKYDVVFFGSKLDQGDRVEWLKHLNEKIPVTIFSWNYQDWQKLGFTANPAVYGAEFNRTVAQSKVILGFNVNDHTWGYWSNRVGKVLTAGGFLLQRYVPGMELFLRDGVDYFSTKNEMVEKVHYYLENESDRKRVAKRGFQIGRERFTSKERVKDLVILLERYLTGGLT